MNVATLQKHIGKFADLVESIQGNSLDKAELKQIEQFLAPHASRTLKDFGDFLKLAAKYDPDKVIEQTKPKSARTSAKPKAPKPTAAEVDAIAHRVIQVYERAKFRTYAEMQTEIASIEVLIESLDKDQLKTVILKLTPGTEFKSKVGAPTLKKTVIEKLQGIWNKAERSRQ